MATGRPAHKPTNGMREQVQNWAAAGLTQIRIAEMLGLAKGTFMKYYSEDYDSGKDRMVGKLFDVSLKVALQDDHKDSVKDRHFLLKTRGGYTEKLDHVSSDGSMTPQQTVYQLPDNGRG
jgi:hypothetical protein